MTWWFFNNYNRYGDDDYPTEEKEDPKYRHEFVDTGFKWTFCKKCNEEGYYEMGKVKTSAGTFCNGGRHRHWYD